jgi:hypothetical protein
MPLPLSTPGSVWVYQCNLTYGMFSQIMAGSPWYNHYNSFNPLTLELNPYTQRYLMRFFTGDFASWTVHFINICLKNQQMQQLFIQFINCVWYLPHVSALLCHPQGAFLVPSERCWIEEQSIENYEWVCCVYCSGAWGSQIGTNHLTRHNTPKHKNK